VAYQHWDLADASVRATPGLDGSACGIAGVGAGRSHHKDVSHARSVLFV